MEEEDWRWKSDAFTVPPPPHRPEFYGGTAGITGF